MNIQKYIAFVKAIEYGSITKAAEVLNYAQSGVSRMIHDLESECKMTLCERGRTGITLTSDGLKLYPHFQQICNEYARLQAKIEHMQEVQTGLIRIGTFSSVATHWLPNMIQRFKEDYPRIEFELLLGDYTEIESWITQGRIDFGFLRLPTKMEMETIFIEEDRLLVVLPKNHPFVHCDQFPLEELMNAPFILLEKGEKAEISEIFTKHKLTPQIAYTTWDDYAVMSMVEKGLGISILPELILQRVPYEIITKQLEIPVHRKIGVGMREQKALSLAAKCFLDYLNCRK